MTRSITAMALLLLAAPAAADSIYGRVSEIEQGTFCIRTRFFPKIVFHVTGQTEFVCRKQRVAFNTLRSDDVVEVRFRTTKDTWEAARVSIRAKGTDCSTR